MSCCPTAALPSPLPFPLGVVACTEPTETDYSLEAGLTAFLKAAEKIDCLIDGRVYPQYVPRDVQQAGYPCIVYELHEVPVEAVTGQSGAMTATVELSCWAPTFGAACALAAVLRKSLQAFRGRFGNTPVEGCWYVDQDDECQQPADDSTTYWHARTLTFDVTYLVPLHTF